MYTGTIVYRQRQGTNIELFLLWLYQATIKGIPGFLSLPRLYHGSGMNMANTKHRHPPTPLSVVESLSS